MRGPGSSAPKAAALNYRHAFHAGNFADLVKHAALLRLLGRLMSGPPLTVIDTHAGRGLYDLAGPEARKSGEAEAGVARLMAAADAPDAFRPLTRAVEALNGGGQVRRYPGSPASSRPARTCPGSGCSSTSATTASSTRWSPPT